MRNLKEEKETERRTICTPVKVEKRDDGTIKSIVGYPIVYNKDSEDMGFIESIAPGAATKALKKSDVRGLKNHDPSLIFARQGINLTLVEDKEGVRIEAKPVDTHNFRETAKEVDIGLLDGQSFGFSVAADEWEDIDKDVPRRTIIEFDIIRDVGPVTYPAYNDTTVALRSLDIAKKKDNKSTSDTKKTAPEKIEPRIIIILKGDKDKTTEQFDFTGDKRFEKAVEKIDSLRSKRSPTTALSDNADNVPTNKKISDKDKAEQDDTLERINKTIERLEK